MTTVWSKLRDAYGPAEEAPRLLKALRAKTAKARAAAREELRDRFGGEEPVSGLPAVVRELSATALDAGAPDLADNLLLLVDLVAGDPDEFLHEPFHGKAAKGRRTEVEEEAVEALAEVEPALRELLGSKDASVRACAAWAIAFLPKPEASTVDALAALLADPEGGARESARFALSVLSRAKLAKAKKALEAAPPGNALHGALSAYLAGIALDDAQLVELGEALALPARPRAEQPWAGGNLADLAAGVLARQHERAKVAVPGILKAIDKGRDRSQMRDAALVLGLVFGAKARASGPLAPKDISPEQRRTLEVLVKSGANADYRAFGLPGDVAGIERLLASGHSPQAPSSGPPIEREIEVAGKGKRPAWQWFEALFDEQVSEPAVLDALKAQLSGSDLLDVLREAARGAFDVPAPSMSLVEAALAFTGDELAAYQALADDILALSPDTVTPPAALLATLPLVRRGAIEAKHERLLTRVLVGDDDAVIARFTRSLSPELLERVKPKPKVRS